MQTLKMPQDIREKLPDLQRHFDTTDTGAIIWECVRFYMATMEKAISKTPPPPHHARGRG